MNKSEPVILSAVDHPDITCVCRVAKKITAACDGCGVVVTGGLHMPDGAHGWYCERCCPCRQYRPSADEVRAIEANRARVLASQETGKRLKTARSMEARTAKLRREAQRQRALAQWADPKARRKLVAGIRRGHASLRRSLARGGQPSLLRS